MLETSTSRFPALLLGARDAAARMSGLWSGLRIMEMRFQDRERILGVSRRDTLPWPPRRRMRGVEGDIFLNGWEESIV